MPVRALADRVGARLIEDSLISDGHDYVVPGKDWDFLIAVHDVDASVRAHLAREPHDLRSLLECLAASRAANVAHIACHRRWWVGSVAAALHEERRMDAEAIDVLARVVGRFDVGDVDVDAVSRTIVIEDRTFAFAEPPGVWVGELPIVRLASVLERVAHRSTWSAPRGRYGIAPARDDVDAWTEWVGDLVTRILAVANRRPDDWLVSFVA